MRVRWIKSVVIACCLQPLLFSSLSIAEDSNSLTSHKQPLLASLSQPSFQTWVQPVKIKDRLKSLNTRLSVFPDDYEAALLKSLVFFRAGYFVQAQKELNKLIEQVPDFHLAHLIRGDMLMSRVKRVDDIGKNSLLDTLYKTETEQLNALREEAQVRLVGAQVHTPQGFLPRQILRLGKSVERAVLVEKSSHRLFVYERNKKDNSPYLMRDFYVSTGKKEGNKYVRGDLRTPEGVYFVTSWIPEDKLPDKYGIGAFPVNYPNELDKRLGKTGYGIWLHGTPSASYSRPPLDSEGCMVLTNEDFHVLEKEIKPGVTPVIIVEKVDWLDKQSWLAERDRAMNALEQWRQDWESMDTERYLSHYSDNFWSSSHNLKSWSNRKKKLAKSKSFQKVKLSDVSLLAYPEFSQSKGNQNKPADIIVARFQQDYKSSNYNSEMQKRLYLQRNANKWQIMYEGK